MNRLLAAGLALLAWTGAARAEALVAQDGAAATIDCRGDAASVQGSLNRLTFIGPCRGLTVQGSDNAVAVDLVPGTTIRIRGDRNRIAYTPASLPPVLVVRGRADQAAPAMAVVMAAPEGPLVVESAPFDVPCTGRDVLVRGDGLRAVLRGGCRSLTVDGGHDTVTAELVPGAPVAIGGAAVIVNYVLVAAGPPPRVRTTAAGLRATLIQHFGATELVLPTQAGGM